MQSEAIVQSSWGGTVEIDRYRRDSDNHLETHPRDLITCCMNDLPHCCIKYLLYKSNIGKEGFLLAHSSRLHTVHHSGMVASHMRSSVRKQQCMRLSPFY